jgi:ribosomal protein L36
MRCRTSRVRQKNIALKKKVIRRKKKIYVLNMEYLDSICVAITNAMIEFCLQNQIYKKWYRFSSIK